MKNSRVNKWKEYRLEIDSNNNLDFSIINSNDELKKMFQLINFDYEDSFIKSGYKKKLSINEHYKSENIINQKEIDKIINVIEKNEIIIEYRNKDYNHYNQHINDDIIKKYFREFTTDNIELKNLINQETTDLKINQINIVENKDKKW